MVGQSIVVGKVWSHFFSQRLLFHLHLSFCIPTPRVLFTSLYLLLQAAFPSLFFLLLAPSFLSFVFHFPSSSSFPLPPILTPAFLFSLCILPTMSLNLTSSLSTKFSKLSSKPSFGEDLGKPVFSKMDEFPENFRTAFDPPPLFRKNSLRFFPQIHYQNYRF